MSCLPIRVLLPTMTSALSYRRLESVSEQQDRHEIANSKPISRLTPCSTASPPLSRPPRVMGLADVALFMVTAGCSLQWTALAAATGPSSLIVWVGGGIGTLLSVAA